MNDRLDKRLATQVAISKLYELLMSQHISISQISRAVYDESLKLTGAGLGLCATIDLETGELVAHAFDRLLDDICGAEETDCRFLKRGEHGYPDLWGVALNTNQPFYTNSPEEHPDAPGVPAGDGIIEQFLAVPVGIGRQRAGLIALANKPGGFNGSDLECVVELARYFGLAIKGVEDKAKLNKSEERYRRLVESMQEGIVMVDADDSITFVNHQICKMLGHSKDDFIGTKLSGYVHPASLQVYEHKFKRRTAGDSEKYELVFNNSAGDKVFTLVSPTPTFDDSGEFTGAFGVFTNITELKIMESNLLQSQKLEAIGQLAAGIAHEINTPTQYVDNNVRFARENIQPLLDIVRSGLSLAGAHNTGQAADTVAEMEKMIAGHDYQFLLDELPEALDEALEGLDRIARIAKSIKQLAHPDRNEKQLVDVNSSIESTSAVSKNEWKYVAGLELDLDPQLPLVPGHRGEINQVFLNLIINSAHAIQEKLGDTPAEKGKITITTGLEKDFVRIDVADTGTGIAEDVQPKVFNPFFTTKEVGRGTGQGLSISHNVVCEKHGGEFFFATVPGRGTTFTVLLPVHDSDMAE